MFTGADYFVVAQHLENEAQNSPSSDAMYRAAISRYYYSCYLTARSKLYKEGQWSNKTLTSHTAVWTTIKQKEQTVGDWYFQLKMLREHADYHLWQPPHLAGSNPINHCQCHSWKNSASDTARFAHDLASWIIDFFNTLP
jgi:hypothetical protein